MDNRVLSLRMRPHALDGLIGQKKVVSAIRSQIKSGRIPHAWMFTGITGAGKTTIARIIAVSLQCPHQKRFGVPCKNCWGHRKDFAIYEVNASELNGVEDIGKIAANSRFAPMPPSKMRVYILDEAQMLSKNAQNLLLKFFEDASSTTVWIICTTEKQKIIRTLQSRCMAYALSSLSFSGREVLLGRAAKFAGMGRPLEDLVDAVNEYNLSSPRMLLNALEKYASGLDARAAVSDVTEANVDTYAMNLALTGGNWGDLCTVLTAATPDDARYIRASAAGWLRGILKKESNAARRNFVAEQLLAVMGACPIDDSGMLYWLWAVLHQVCARFKREGR